MGTYKKQQIQEDTRDNKQNQQQHTINKGQTGLGENWQTQCLHPELAPNFSFPTFVVASLMSKRLIGATHEFHRLGKHFSKTQWKRTKAATNTKQVARTQTTTQ